MGILQNAINKIEDISSPSNEGEPISRERERDFKRKSKLEVR